MDELKELPLTIQDCGPDGAKDWFHLTLADGSVIWSSANKPLMQLIVDSVNGQLQAKIDSLEAERDMLEGLVGEKEQEFIDYKKAIGG